MNHSDVVKRQACLLGTTQSTARDGINSSLEIFKHSIAESNFCVLPGLGRLDKIEADRHRRFIPIPRRSGFFIVPIRFRVQFTVDQNLQLSPNKLDSSGNDAADALGKKEESHTQEEVKEVLSQVIIEGLLQDGSVRLHQFGSFHLKWRGKKAKAHISFRPGSQLRGILNPNPEPIIPLIIKVIQTISRSIKALEESVRTGSFPKFIRTQKIAPQDVKPLLPAGELKQLFEQPLAEIKSATMANTSSTLNTSKPSAAVPAQSDQSEPPLEKTARLDSDALAQHIVQQSLLRQVSRHSQPVFRDLVDDEPQSEIHDSLVAAKVRERHWAKISLLTIFALLLVVAAIPWSKNTEIADLDTATKDNKKAESVSVAVVEQPLRLPEIPVVREPPKPETKIIDTVVVGGGELDSSQHNIYRGDNLWSLANKYYGDPYLWPYIYSFNREVLNNPDVLGVGVQIKIPALEHGPDKLTLEDKKEIADAYRLIYKYFRARRSSKASAFLQGAKRYAD